MTTGGYPSVGFFLTNVARPAKPVVVRHGRYVVFQLAEVVVTRALSAEILRRIGRLRPRPPLPALAGRAMIDGHPRGEVRP